LSQLLAHTEEITLLLENAKDALVDVIYLDFSRAFDKVDHGVLAHTLANIGVAGKLGTWIWSSLQNRSQFVTANGTSGESTPVISGVPQGTVLGPVLFLVVLGTLNKSVKHSVVSSFADDTKIVRAIEAEDDSALLHEDLNSIYSWAREVNMQFNCDTFDLLRYGLNNNDLKSKTQYSDSVGQPIPE
jgi:hypothetical protein